MRNLIGFPEFDNSGAEEHDTVLENVADAVKRLTADTEDTGTCHTCAYAALVHLATVMARREGIEPEEIADIVANAETFADKLTAQAAREAFAGDDSGRQEAAR